MQKCIACQFYDRSDARSEDKGVRWGKCRRTGPIANPSMAKSYIVEGVWPSVRDDDWCGEWVVAQRKTDAADGEPRNLLMNGGAPSVRPPAGPMGSLMIPANAPEVPPLSIQGRFGSD